MSGRSGETTVARLRRNRSPPSAKNWPVIPPHLPHPTWNPFRPMQNCQAANKAPHLRSQVSKPNLARRQLVHHRQPRPALNRSNPDRQLEPIRLALLAANKLQVSKFILRSLENLSFWVSS